MTRDLYLAIDVGTGGLRSALVDRDGRILAFSHKEHEQIVPRFGWSEQRPADWWAGTQATIRAVLGKVDNAAGRVAAICACGQMHGSVLIDDDGNPTLDAVPLWNDKRTVPQVDAYIAREGTAKGLALTANMPAPAWPAFKIAWIAENWPEALTRAKTLLMPKDWINFKLTGERAQDPTEASLSYLMDWRTRAWSDELCDAVGVPRALLAPLQGPDGVVRIVLCGALGVLGVTAIGPYGLAIAFAPLPGVLFVAARGNLRTDDGPPADWGEVTQNLGWLLAGSIFAAGLVNAGPLAATILANDNEKELVTQFTYGVLLARIPLFLFQAVQAALLPRLSRLAARNEIAEFRSGLTRLLKVVVVVAVVGTVGAYLLGPFVIEKFYEATLSGATLATLAFGSALYMLALALAQAVIALRGHALVALGWGCAAITFVLVTWLNSTDSLFRRVEIGLVASSAMGLLAFALALRAKLKSGVEPSTHSMIDAITDMPFET